MVFLEPESLNGQYMDPFGCSSNSSGNRINDQNSKKNSNDNDRDNCFSFFTDLILRVPLKGLRGWYKVGFRSMHYVKSQETTTKIILRYL